MDVDEHVNILYSLCSIVLVFQVFLEDDFYHLYIGTEIATSHLAAHNYEWKSAKFNELYYLASAIWPLI